MGYRIQKERGLKMKFLPEALAYHLHRTTFRQFRERMVRVGYSRGLFHEIWPKLRLPPTTDAAQPSDRFSDSRYRPMLTLDGTPGQHRRSRQSRHLCQSSDEGCVPLQISSGLRESAR